MANARIVGKQISMFLADAERLLNEKVIEKTHLIGYSLGAHVAGYAGEELKNLQRITGN